MKLKSDDPIVARATPLGQGAVGIVRLSGEGVIDIADRLFVPGGKTTFRNVPVRELAYGEVRAVEENGSKTTLLDRALGVRFQAPHSFTGEDVVELHLHGNPLIIESVVEACVRAGCRLAEPGEFSRRAVMNGKMDLTQAEGLADLIRAESERALALAHRQMGGEFSKRLASFRKDLIDLLALVELELDFVQEGYELLPRERLVKTLEGLHRFSVELLDAFRAGDRLRRGPRVLLLGRPNAGKSSLFNAFVGFSRALVSDIPGTTRDYLEERVVHRGHVMHILDSAGLRETVDPIESEGVGLSSSLIPLSDAVLYLIDSTETHDVQREEARMFEQRVGDNPDVAFLPVLTKSDATDQNPAETWSEMTKTGEQAITCSVYQRETVEHLLDSVLDRLFAASTDGMAASSTSEQLYLLTERQKLLIEQVKGQIESVLGSIGHEMTHSGSPGGVHLNTNESQVEFPVETELISEDLRHLLEPLSQLTGELTNEDVLDAVFSGFCIGK
jgi:tRNA modification GTPase